MSPLSRSPGFREIALGDMSAIFAVREATWHTDTPREDMQGLGITHDSVVSMLEEGTHRGWLCEQDGRVVGFAMGDRTNGEMWVIAVLKEFENRGIGKELLRLVEEWLAEEGWTEAWLTTDPDETDRAVGFYKHLGWVDWKVDVDRYMKKQLGKQRG